MTRVLIAAPTPALRAGLRALLASAEIEVVGETPTLAETAAELPAADVIVIGDAALLAQAARITHDDGRIAMLVLSDDAGVAATLRALPLAGWGMVPSDSSAAEITAALLAVGQGLVALPLALVERLLAPRAPIAALAAPASEALTSREREVLDLVGQGLSNKLIARELQVSEHTVKFHISSIFSKLGASSRTEAISLGARRGLITLWKAALRPIPTDLAAIHRNQRCTGTLYGCPR